MATINTLDFLQPTTSGASLQGGPTQPLVVSSPSAAQTDLSKIQSTMNEAQDKITAQSAINIGKATANALAKSIADQNAKANVALPPVTPQPTAEQLAQQKTADYLKSIGVQTPSQVGTANYGFVETPSVSEIPIPTPITTASVSTPFSAPTEHDKWAVSSPYQEGTQQFKDWAVGHPEPLSAVDVSAMTPEEQDTYARNQQAKLAQDAFDLYTSNQKKIDALNNGTIPLTDDQQNQLNLLKAQFEELKNQQLLANENYTGGITISGIVSGRSRYAPEIESGNIKKSVDDGIKRINDLDIKAASAIASLKKGFKDDDVNAIRASYADYTAALALKDKVFENMHNDAVKAVEAATKAASEAQARTDQLKQQKIENEYRQNQSDVLNQLNSDKFSYQQKQDAIDNALASEKITLDQANSLRDYELKKQKLEQDNWKIEKDSFGNPVAFKFDPSTGQMNTKDPGYSSMNTKEIEKSPFFKALNQNISKIPLGKESEYRSRLLGYLQDGDVETAKSFLLNLAIENLPADKESAVTERFVAIDSLKAIKLALDTYVKKTGDTGILAGNVEKLAEKLGTTTDPELAKLVPLLTVTKQAYRSGVTGKAFTEAESKEYKEILPDITNIGKLNNARINSLIDVFNRQNKSLLEIKLGKGNYDQIFGANARPATVDEFFISHPDQQDTVERMLRDFKNEGKTLEQAQEKVLDFYFPLLPQQGLDFNEPLSMGQNRSEVSKIASAIGQFESGGNYKAQGPVVTSGTYKGQRAQGKYQIMEGNIGPWSREVLGRTVTKEEFLNNPQIQDQIAEAKMQKIFDKHGTVEDVASVWFSGQPLVKAGSAKDVLGTTVPSYIKNVRANYDKLA